MSPQPDTKLSSLISDIRHETSLIDSYIAGMHVLADRLFGASEKSDPMGEGPIPPAHPGHLGELGTAVHGLTRQRVRLAEALSRFEGMV